MTPNMFLLQSLQEVDQQMIAWAFFAIDFSGSSSTCLQFKL